MVFQGLENGADAVLLGRTGGRAGQTGESEGEGRGPGSPWGSLRVLFDLVAWGRHSGLPRGPLRSFPRKLGGPGPLTPTPTPHPSLSSLPETQRSIPVCTGFLSPCCGQSGGGRGGPQRLTPAPPSVGGSRGRGEVTVPSLPADSGDAASLASLPATPKPAPGPSAAPGSPYL